MVEGILAMGFQLAVGRLSELSLENQPENLLNKIISLTTIDDSSIKLTRIGKPNNITNIGRELAEEVNNSLLPLSSPVIHTYIHN